MLEATVSTVWWLVANRDWKSNFVDYFPPKIRKWLDGINCASFSGIPNSVIEIAVCQLHLSQQSHQVFIFMCYSIYLPIKLIIRNIDRPISPMSQIISVFDMGNQTNISHWIILITFKNGLHSNWNVPDIRANIEFRCTSKIEHSIDSDTIEIEFGQIFTHWICLQNYRWVNQGYELNLTVTIDYSGDSSIKAELTFVWKK